MITFEQTVQPNGQACRIWEPPVLLPDAPLIIVSHQYTGNEQIAPSAAGYTYAVITACIAEGWRVAASNMHANSWGNPTAVNDNVDLYSMMNTRQAVPKVLMWGQSMGGLASALAVPDGRIPVVGVALIDAVTNLAKAYGPSAGFADFSGTIKTAYGIASDGSDYAAKTAGSDPNLLAASAFTSKRWRFYQSTSDTTQVEKATNADAFRTKIAAAPESGMVTHRGGHLANYCTHPADFVAFAKRCFA
ncbi:MULTISPECIES: alpha/beta hydrolase [unclassified Rhodococcus (in: high G+C Gram-positive bacteria)]|uniref:alpha/beta hydrolase n=1 Tax=unclassified Rhodococcus (in: high G+C Gram-positive bacteria) TaxID=192944 RepID=UPI00117A1CB4|nr:MULTISPECIES: alpha/beta hydrolase [unclassified Rhodococcus (in: high G+C Gram-positive bacteria)]